MKKTRIKLVLIIILTVTFTSLIPKPSQGYVMNEYSLSNISQVPDTKPLNIVLAEGGTKLYFTMPDIHGIGRMDIAQLPTAVIDVWSPPTASELWDLDEHVGSECITFPSPGGATLCIVGSTIVCTDYSLNRIWRAAFGGVPGNYALVEWYWEIPTPDSGPRGISVLNDYAWFIEYKKDRIGKLNITLNTIFDPENVFVEYQLPSGSRPNDILATVIDGKTEVWFTMYGKDSIGVLTESDLTDPTSQANIREYALPAGSKPHSLTMDPDGVIWFTCQGANMIGRFNPWSAEIILYTGIPTSNSQPTGIAVDNHTRDVWFTEFAGHKVCKYIPGSNLFIEYPTLSSGSSPAGIVVQKPTFGNLPFQAYFTLWSANKIGILEEGEPTVKYGGTITSTVTKITTAFTNRLTAETTSTTRTATSTNASIDWTFEFWSNPLYNIYNVGGTSTMKDATSYMLYTSTRGVSIKMFTEFHDITTTSTSTLTSYAATEPQTSTHTYIFNYTSYIATTPVTYTSTSTYYMELADTTSIASTSTISRNETLNTTITYTEYESTTSATTTITQTQLVPKVYTESETVTNTKTAQSPFYFPCIIATAVYGSELSPQVQYLRSFRDHLVMRTFAGSNFMELFNAWYYSFSPTVARCIAVSPQAKTVVKAFFYPLFSILKASAATYHCFSFSPDLGITLAGIMASGLIGLIYDAPLAIIVKYYVWCRRRLVLKLGHLKPLLYVWLSSLIGVGLAEVFRLSFLMKVSAAALVLSSMAGSALLASTLLFTRISRKPDWRVRYS